MTTWRVVTRCIATVAACAIITVAQAADYDITYTGQWRSSDDVVSGWDWTLPSGLQPTKGSGIFNLNSKVPDGFPGYHLRQVNANWRDLEPVEGQYDFSSIYSALNDTSYDGVMLNVRGMVVSIEDANGNSALSSEITAPNWLHPRVPKVTEPLKGGYQITNMQIYDPLVKSKLLQLINAIGASGIPSHPKLIAQIVHGVSSTRGEECCVAQGNSDAVLATMKDVIRAWAAGYGDHSKKLTWLDERELYDTAVTEQGMGVRGGIIEYWIRWQYTTGESRKTGQLYSNGYLSVDEAFAPIAEGRTWMDQNEEYVTTMRTPPETLQQNYRMAMLRMLQMRRNIAWTEKNSFVNPSLLNWFSLELGKNVTTAPDAWVALISTWTRYNGDKEVKNLERWLYQRDINGVATRTSLRSNHGFNASNNDMLDPSKWYVDLARTGGEIGIAIDDRFLSGGPHSVAIKVTYFDSEAGAWRLEYAKADGTTGLRKIQGGATGQVRTATFLLNDFVAQRQGMDFDFSLRSESGNTPFMFVRVIKLEQTVPPPHPPDAVTVQ